MSLYRPNNKNAFVFVAALLFVVLLLLIPLRPSVWDRDLIVEQQDSLSTVLPTLDSFIVTTTIEQDTQVVLMPNGDSTKVDTNIIIQPIEIIDSTPVIFQPDVPTLNTNLNPPIKASHSKNGGINLSFLFLILGLFSGLAFLIYKFLTARWQKQYWLQYSAKLQPLDTVSSAQNSIQIDFLTNTTNFETTNSNEQAAKGSNDSAQLLTTTANNTLPDNKSDIDDKTIEKEQSIVIDKVPDLKSSRPTNAQQQSTTSTVARNSTQIPLKNRSYVLIIVELFTRLPRIVFEISRGIVSIFSFFSKGNQTKKRPVDLKWQDGISIVMILFFLACKLIIFPHQPTSITGNILLGLLVWFSPCLLRLHWALGALGGFIIFGEIVSLGIYIVLEMTKNMAPSNDNTLTYTLCGLFTIIVVFWARKKKLLAALTLLLAVSITGYFIFLPYLNNGWDWALAEYSGWGDVIARAIGIYIIYEIFAAIILPNKKKKAPFQTTKKQITTPPPKPLEKTIPTPKKIKTTKKTYKPLSSEEENALFRLPNWYKKTDLTRLNIVSMPNTGLDEQSEFIVLYLPDCININQLYLSNNRFEEIPYEISELEQLQVVNLSNNHISQISPDIAYLSKLNSLYLANNKITSIPDELAQLTKLNLLDLTGNPLDQTAIDKLQAFFPKATIKFDAPIEENVLEICPIVEDNQVLLSKIQKLLKKELKTPSKVHYISALIKQNLSDLPVSVFQQFDNLGILLLNSNNFTEIPQAVYCLPSIKQLSLSFNKITTIPDQIGSLKTLKELDLSGNHIQSFSPQIVNLPNLERLRLGNMGLTTFPAFLLKMTQLKSINLSGNHILRIPDQIQTLNNLEDLNLSFSGLNVIPDIISELIHLKALDWTGNNLTKLPSALTKLYQLKKLAIGFNPELNNSSVILSKFSQLKELYLSGLKADEQHPLMKTVGDITTLETLWISHNVMQKPPLSIYQLKNLRSLSIANNQLIYISKEIGQLSNLQYLHLENNALTELPSEIKQLKKLRQLNLTNNQLAIKARRAIQRALPKVEIKF